MPTRTQQDAVDEQIDAALLAARVHSIEIATEHTSNELTKHVTECAAIQKRVYGVVIFVAGWIVAHSPEGLTIMGKALRAVVP